MKYYFIYALVFLAFLLPSLYFVLSNKKEPKKVEEKQKEELPMIFNLLKMGAKTLEYCGFGKFCCKNFKAKTEIIQNQINFSQLKLSVETVYCTQVVAMVVFGLIGCGVMNLIVDRENIYGVPVAGVILAFMGSALPGIAIGNLAQKRQMMILQTIPYSIDLIASAMRGGLDFSAAIRFYVNLGLKTPLVEEYSIMLREMELGIVRSAALENMANRVKIKEFTSFVAAIILGIELGAPLTETMEIQGEEMRKARFSLAECKAQKAPSLMLLPMALFILPAVFIIILTPIFLKMREAGVPLF